MKLNFFQFASRLRAKTELLLIGLFLLPTFVMGQIPYTNFEGTVSGTPPQVDATTFVNSATWNIVTTGPYMTAHTLNYTNRGRMTGSIGWEFDYGPSITQNPGGRGTSADMSANFFNDNNGTIIANDGGTAGPEYFSYLASKLLVSATNIVNKGALTAGPDGEIVLNGNNVVLARSSLTIPPIQGNGSVNNPSQGTYVPDTAIYPEYWGAGVTNVYTQAVWQYGTNAASAALPNITVVNPCGETNVAPSLGSNPVPFFGGFTPSFYAWTNMVDPASITNIAGTNGPAVYATNRILRQAVFVVVNPNIITNNPATNSLIRFSPSSQISNLFQTVSVWLPATNGTSLYIVDQLASETNRGVLLNNSDGGINLGFNPLTSCTGPEFRPANYNVERVDNTFADGASGNVTNPPDNFLYDSSFSNNIVAAYVSAYQAYVDNLTYDPEGVALTNLLGKIVINANNLDLTRTTISCGGSQVRIQANNLVGTPNLISAQNLSYDLGSSNGTVNVLNLAPRGALPSWKGTLSLWSALWTNYMTVTNFITTTNGLAPTNSVTEFDFHVLLVDATRLSSTVPVNIQNLTLQTNAVISDSITNLGQSFLFKGQNLTISAAGTLGLPPGANWNSAMAPALQYFTNNGSLTIPGVANFGNDTASPYVEFVNNGQIKADGGMTVHSADFQVNALNGGAYIYTAFYPPSSAGFSATVQSAELNGAISGAGIYFQGDIQFIANTLLMTNFTLSSFGGALDFTVANTLSDNGTPNYLSCDNGFNLWAAPQMGNLSGTTITDYAPSSSSGVGPEIDHAWAGVDYGPTNWAAAYTNNAPIGTLALIAQAPSQIPTFHFYGTGGAPSNAIYVTTLDLSQLTSNPGDLTGMIQVDPGMKIYFSQVLLGFIPPNGQTPAEYLQSLSFYPGQSGQFAKMPNIAAAQSGLVDWNTTYQPIDGFGASSAWRSTWTTAQADMFFSTNSGTGLSYNGTNFSFTGIGLSLLRNHIYPAGYPATTTSPSAIPFTTETNIMLMAQARGAKIWSSPWTPPTGFKSVNEIYPPYGSTTNPLWGGSFINTPANYDNYANQLANYVVSMKNLGINLYAISIQNEPDAYNTNYEACEWTAQEIHDFVPYLYQYLQDDGVGATKIMLPESQNWSDPLGLAYTTLNDPAVAADVSIVADHDYVQNNLTGDLTIPTPLYPGSGKSTWETEVAQIGPPGQNTYDGGINNGIYWAKRIYLFLTQAQVNAWNYWWLISLNPDNEGLTDTNGVPAKRMYVLGQFSRFVRPGFVRIGVNAPANSTNLLITAFKATNSQNFAIVAINPNVNIDLTNTFSLANFPAVSAVTPWMTSSSNSLARMPDVPVSGSSFTYFIPAQSVVTFVNQGYNGGASSVGNPTNIVISSTAYHATGHSFVLTWNATQGKTYSVFKTGALEGSSTAWSAVVRGYPAGGAAGGSLSYTDTTATATGPAFYRVMAEQSQ